MAGKRPLEKWDHELLDTQEILCNVVGSGSCHCFPGSFIARYRRCLNIPDDRELQCAKNGCTDPATDGAHLRFGEVVVILPLCHSCNTPGADNCFRITRSRYPQMLKLYCCCFNIPSRYRCYCPDCTHEGCRTCRCWTRNDGRCQCPH